MVQAIVKHNVPPNISIITQVTNNYIMGSKKKRSKQKLSDNKTNKRKKNDQLENYAKGPDIFR